MAELRFAEVVRVLGADSVRDADICFKHYHFDTRLMEKENCLFFAVDGEAVDGHKFVKTLRGLKNCAAVVRRGQCSDETEVPLIFVDDPLKAAQKLASYVRDQFRHTKYIGVTGSAGKTTTKEFIASLLSWKYKTGRSWKNWNNWLGLPFSILKLDGDEDYAVFELGMSYPGIGEIDLTAGILRPDCAVLLNAYPVHLEFLKTVENVAKAKSEIINHLRGDDFAVINGEQDVIARAVEEKPGRKIRVGCGRENQICLKKIEKSEGRSVLTISFYGINEEFETSVINDLQILNLVYAITVVMELGMKAFEIRAALKNIKPVSGRGEVTELGDRLIIDETYNSNPVALLETLKWVDSEYRHKQKTAVVGDMYELGDDEVVFHENLGKDFNSLNFQRLITVGKLAEKLGAAAVADGFDSDSWFHAENAHEAGDYIKRENIGGVLIFKGSRGVGLEKAVEVIS